LLAGNVTLHRFNQVKYVNKNRKSIGMEVLSIISDKALSGLVCFQPGALTKKNSVQEEEILSVHAALWVGPAGLEPATY
jgi:hypothetical protein